MTTAGFDRIIANRHNHRMSLLQTKGDEYSRKGDRLWNFKNVAAECGNTATEACIGLMAKHSVSIRDIVDRVVHEGFVPTEELLNEKFSDIHNYYDLLEANLREHVDMMEIPF